MNTLLAVDPGIRGCGVAFFSNKKLQRADYVKSFAKEGNQTAEARAMAKAIGEWTKIIPGHMVFEWPRIYRNVKDKDPNDLLALCAVNASIATLFPYAVADSYYPSEWKGNMPKTVCQGEILKRLDLNEARVLTEAATRAKSLSHNMIDSIGLGLFAVGRFSF